ncbi:MAG: hypothetical protein ABJB47_09065 [Actinomycetota bacterium]
MNELTDADRNVAAEQARWLGSLLAPPDSFQVTSVIPGGYEAYARVLHPAEEPLTGDRLVRWADVVRWGGKPLRRDAPFHSIALPLGHPAGDAPWSGAGPQPGRLYQPDAEVLASILRDWTATPERCWFCHRPGSDQGVPLQSADSSLFVLFPERVPALAGPVVRVPILPGQECLLSFGPVETATDTTVWWPEDHAWCVASDPDLGWTYVAGPGELIGLLVADQRIEALPARADDSLAQLASWVEGWVDTATDTLLADGEAAISTARGTVRSCLKRPSKWRGGSLRTWTESGDGAAEGGAGWTGISRGTGAAQLRDLIALRLSIEVLGLAGEQMPSIPSE